MTVAGCSAESFPRTFDLLGDPPAACFLSPEFVQFRPQLRREVDAARFHCSTRGLAACPLSYAAMRARHLPSLLWFALHVP